MTGLATAVKLKPLKDEGFDNMEIIRFMKEGILEGMVALAKEEKA